MYYREQIEEVLQHQKNGDSAYKAYKLTGVSYTLCKLIYSGEILPEDRPTKEHYDTHHTSGGKWKPDAGLRLSERECTTCHRKLPIVPGSAECVGCVAKRRSTANRIKI